MTPGDKSTQRRFEYLLHQLELAHKRNELVDNQRFTVLQIFFGFQALILGASVFKGSDAAAIRQQLGSVTLLLPVLALGIGFSLFVVYFRQHLYMLAYKSWTRNLEQLLRSLVFGDDSSSTDSVHEGTLYFDSNQPAFTFEGTIIFTLIAMCLFNLGTVSLLLQMLDATLWSWIVVVVIGSGVHLGATLYLQRA